MPPELSIILTTAGSFPTVQAACCSYRNQTAVRQLELILVGPPELESSCCASFGPGISCTKVVMEQSGDESAARRAGLHSAGGRWVVFGDDHTFPEPNWAEVILSRLKTGGWAGVGSEMGNANPAGVVSWASMLLSQGRWMVPSRAEERDHLPPHASAYDRRQVLVADALNPDCMESEWTLQDEIRKKGGRFHLEPKAKTNHLNISRIRPFLEEQYYAGWVFAAKRSRSWGSLRRMIYAAGMIWVMFKKGSESIKPIVRSKCRWRMFPALPLCFLGLVAWSLGEMMGYAWGLQNAMERFSAYTSRRSWHLKPTDRLVRNDGSDTVIGPCATFSNTESS